MTGITADWLDVGELTDIPLRGARTIAIAGGEEIAVFRTGDGSVFALINRCPHKGGRLNQGIIHGHAVTCPLHNWNISLRTGEALGEDRGCTPTVPVKLSAGRVLMSRSAALAVVSAT